MHFEIPSSEPLSTLDDFFRAIWVECCDHLSGFEIGGTSYADEPEDFPFEMFGAEIREIEDDDEGDVDEEDEDEKVVGEENAYCDKCARRSKEEEMMLPVVNSPRVGVCGYEG